MYIAEKLMQYRNWLPAIALSLIAIACRPVKPYQRAWLNDAAMRPGKQPIDKFDETAHGIREGATGGNGRTSGGCGCN